MQGFIIVAGENDFFMAIFASGGHVLHGCRKKTGKYISII